MAIFSYNKKQLTANRCEESRKGKNIYQFLCNSRLKLNLQPNQNWTWSYLAHSDLSDGPVI